MVKEIMDLQKCSHPNPQNLCIWYLTCRKDLIEVVKVKDLEIAETVLVYLDGPV